MKWRNALRDELPGHLQPVLVCYFGIYYATVFDAVLKCFILRDEPDASIAIAEVPIYWIEME